MAKRLWRSKEQTPSAVEGALPDPPDNDSERIEFLIQHMTLAEKLAQLGGLWSTDLVGTGVPNPIAGDEGFSPDAAASRMPHGIGQVTRISANTSLRPAEVAAFMNDIQHWLVNNTRLGIPAVVHEEAVAGFCAREAVQFPQAIGLGATFDETLLGQVATHIRSEMLAVGARHALSPVLDVARDPRWGRVEETYGEDPVLAGTLGTAYVRALQNNDGGGLIGGVVCTGKHFLGYAASNGGLNQGPAEIGSRELREVHAEPFAAAIRDAELRSVMNSYSSVDGLPPAGSRALLTELLRDELGFDGTVVADYFAVDMLRTHHGVAPTKGVAAAKALMAGIDLELPILDCYSEANLGALVEAGVVPIDAVDDAVRRMLTQKVELGLFEDPYVEPEVATATFGNPIGRRLARRAATESIVLLDNPDALVPLDTAALSERRIKRIAVIGPASDDPRLLQGDYHYPAHSEILHDDTSTGAFAAGPHMPESVTPLEGIRGAIGSEVEVTHALGCGLEPGDSSSGIAEACTVAEAADVVVLCLGGRSGLTLDATVGETRDATDLDLVGDQMALLRAVAATGTPVITVVISGRVHTLGEVERLSAATVLAWVPGVEGGNAIADILVGNEAPSGRLPITLPRNVGQVPIHYAHRRGGGRSQFWGDYTDSPTTPLHPFGYGLSTTTFAYSGVEAIAGSTTESTLIRVTVANTGERAADEVVQLYAADEVASVARPVRQLIGFTRVHLQPGESATVAFEVHPSRLAFYDEDFRFVCEPGAFDFEIGGCAGSPAVSVTVDLDGEVHQYRQSDVVATGVALNRN